MDVVYSWVNGSDPEFIDTIRKFDSNYDKSRFDDKNELKYSLRSLDKYAPWVRNIYIITNGQVPKWLDLSNERIRIVPHEMLISNVELLPLFSSAAIETFIHKIPNLSHRFLYLNDDIFLGAELYPEDLYTHSEGVRIYQAWLVPDCAVECPWTYIGDMSCDPHCNIEVCQYDGGDCTDDNENVKEPLDKGKESYVKRILKTMKHSKPKMFSRRKIHSILKSSNRTGSFKDMLMKQKMSSNKTVIRELVDNFNRQLRNSDLGHESSSASGNKSIHNAQRSSSSLTDIFSQSLIYTNMLLNRRYGFKARHVIAHVGFLMETPIIEAMHNKFSREIQTTATHRFRASNDVQFSFLYYSFLMEEMHRKTIDTIFNEFDTDHSLTWSDREIRTFLAKTFPLPLDWSTKTFFEEVIQNCSSSSSVDENETLNKMQYTTIYNVYERYQDSHLVILHIHGI